MALKIIELESVQNYNSGPAAQGHCAIPLFHGTRMYALQASREERERFYTACSCVIAFAKKFLWNCPIEDDTLVEYIRTKNPQFLGAVVSQYKSAAYEYGSLYLTTGYPTAIRYAHNAGGELGQWAYSQCVGFCDFQIDLDAEISQAAEIVMEEYEKYRSSEPVVLVYSGVCLKDLYTERGYPIVRYDADGNPDVAYNRHHEEDLYETEVDDDGACVMGYRLDHPQIYTAQLIRHKDLKAGFAVFTKITDIDKYIRWNHIEI